MRSGNRAATLLCWVPWEIMLTSKIKLFTGQKIRCRMKKDGVLQDGTLEINRADGSDSIRVSSSVTQLPGTLE